MNAPEVRTVCQLTGQVSERPSQFFQAMASADAQLEAVRIANEQRDEAIRQRDDARAERDNMVDVGIKYGQLSDYLKHAIADRDEWREMYEEQRDKHDAAQCRMDELAAEVHELQTALATARSERDTAQAYGRMSAR